MKQFFLVVLCVLAAWATAQAKKTPAVIIVLDTREVYNVFLESVNKDLEKVKPQRLIMAPKTKVVEGRPVPWPYGDWKLQVVQHTKMRNQQGKVVKSHVMFLVSVEDPEQALEIVAFSSGKAQPHQIQVTPEVFQSIERFTEIGTKFYVIDTDPD